MHLASVLLLWHSHAVAHAAYPGLSAVEHALLSVCR